LGSLGGRQTFQWAGHVRPLLRTASVAKVEFVSPEVARANRTSAAFQQIYKQISLLPYANSGHFCFVITQTEVKDLQVIYPV